jgi:hypothetical protein
VSLLNDALASDWRRFFDVELVPVKISLPRFDFRNLVSLIVKLAKYVGLGFLVGCVIWFAMILTRAERQQ